jgi:hypothetical protein
MEVFNDAFSNYESSGTDKLQISNASSVRRVELRLPSREVENGSQ